MRTGPCLRRDGEVDARRKRRSDGLFSMPQLLFRVLFRRRFDEIDFSSFRHMRGDDDVGGRTDIGAMEELIFDL